MNLQPSGQVLVSMVKGTVRYEIEGVSDLEAGAADLTVDIELEQLVLEGLRVTLEENFSFRFGKAPTTRDDNLIIDENRGHDVALGVGTFRIEEGLADRPRRQGQPDAVIGDQAGR